MQAAKQRIHTNDVPSADRYEAWRHMISNALYPFATYPLPGRSRAPFSADFWGARGRKTLAAAGSISPALSVVSRADASSADERRVQVFLSLAGGGIHRDDRGSVEVRPGKVFVTSASRPRTYARTAISNSVMIELDVEQLALSHSQIRQVLFQPLAVSVAMLRLMRDSVTNLIKLPTVGADSTDRYLAGAVDLVLRSAIDLEPDHSGTRDARIHQVRQYCERNLADSTLSVESIASALTMSRRTLYNLFSGIGTTPIALLTEMRVSRAQKLLSVRPTTEISLTEVAGRCGFTSSDQLYRAFRRIAGTSPAAFRASVGAFEGAAES